ncbi:MAG TPA: 16S rRNA (adenine(1518)-N(6)/adenine(1519)-N(6))-dimethyltransferase, partial [Nocardioides sp.]
AQRRKTLRATLKNLAGSSQAAERALTHAGVDPMARGEVLGVEEFARVAEGLFCTADTADTAGVDNA